MKDLKFTNSEKEHILSKVKLLRDYHSLVSFMTPEMENFIVKNFASIIKFLPCLKHSTCFQDSFERIVINNNVNKDKSNARLKSYSQIQYPPHNVLSKIPYNRANLPKQSVFYAAYGSLVSALETKPAKGNLYTHSIWQQKQNTQITYLPIYHKESIILTTSEFTEDWKNYQSYLGTLDKNVAVVVEEIYDFIATVFTTQVNPLNRIEYLFSAIISDIFMNDSKFNVDCIYYPSVAGDFVASNIAVKPKVLDNLFNLVEINESFCSYSDANKRWLSYRTGKAINIDRNGENIKWQTETIYDETINILMKEFNVQLA